MTGIEPATVYSDLLAVAPESYQQIVADSRLSEGDFCAKHGETLKGIYPKLSAPEAFAAASILWHDLQQEKGG
jgi:hypothetical protein